MKTENDLNDDILKITMNIYENHPELAKFITEMPVTMPDKTTPEINIKHLQNYYDSLNDLMKKYDTNHHITMK